MNYSQSNPLEAALADGLTFPIYAKLVGASGGTAEVLFESVAVCHTLLFRPPIDFPCKWMFTGSNQATSTVTQTAIEVETLFDRVRRRLN